MMATMDEAGGLGLAAPQIGVGLRVIVIGVAGTRVAMVNPAFIWWSNEERQVEEACLSIPGKKYRVKRHLTVSVVYTTRRGKVHTMQHVAGLAAYAIQHEMDHLDGVLISDVNKGVEIDVRKEEGTGGG